MKNIVNTLILTAMVILFSACGATNHLTMGVTEPAIVHLPSEIKRIGIINRSLPSKGNSTLDKIEKILSAEGLEIDKKGSESAILALASELSVIRDFEEVKIIKEVEEVQKGLGVMPASLSWEIVEKICNENNVDVLFSLAFYDTDTKANFQVATMKMPNSLGIDVDVPAQEVTLLTNVNSGWRIYNPWTKLVLDERLYDKRMTFKGKGVNPMKAIEAIARRNETIQEYSRNVGIHYAQRLIPKNIRVTRDYFVSGTDNFKIAQRRAQAGDWDGAAELWELELGNSDAKIAGRAHYNMAIINEINGDLNKAIEYATKSYVDYRNNIALNYLNLLKRRIRQNQILENQISK